VLNTTREDIILLLRVCALNHNRTKIEIAYDILTLCKTTQNINGIMSHLRLNRAQATVMVDYLLLRGFLEENGHLYRTSDFGSEFASGLKTLFDIWNLPSPVPLCSD